MESSDFHFNSLGFQLHFKDIPYYYVIYLQKNIILQCYFNINIPKTFIYKELNKFFLHFFISIYDPDKTAKPAKIII